MKMKASELGIPLWGFIIGVALTGAATFVWTQAGAAWDTAQVSGTLLFALLIGLAGYFPLPVAPQIKAGMTTAPIFGAVLTLSPAGAVAAAALGTLAYHLALLARRDPELKLPWYKYPFNLGEATLTTLVGALVWTGQGALNLGVTTLGAAVGMYLVNTVLVSVAVALQLRLNPALVWVMGTKENGLAELSLFAFGFMSAVAYAQDPRYLVALLLPAWVVYLAFSRLSQSTAQLAEALERVKDMQGRLVSQAKLASIGAFSLDLAHQLRNPLFVVVGHLESLRDTRPNVARRELHVRASLESAWRMQELIDAFVKAGRMQPSMNKVVDMLEDALQMSQLRYARSVRVTRKFEKEDLLVEGNPVLLREAFLNLMNNAVEAVDEKGMITLSVSRNADRVLVSIEDNGQGIPEQKLRALFEPFNSTKPQGLGLGLFMSKHVVELHGGKIAVESGVGKGTRLTLDMPIGQIQTDSPVRAYSGSSAVPAGLAQSSS